MTAGTPVAASQQSWDRAGARLLVTSLSPAPIAKFGRSLHQMPHHSLLANAANTFWERASPRASTSGKENHHCLSSLAEEKQGREGMVWRRRLPRVGPALPTATQSLGQCHEQQHQKTSSKCCGDRLPTAEKLGAILLNLNKCSVNVNTNSFSVG